MEPGASAGCGEMFVAAVGDVCYCVVGTACEAEMDIVC